MDTGEYLIKMAALAKWIADESDKKDDRISELEAQLAEANKAKDEAREVMESVLTMVWHTGASDWLSKHGGR